MQLFDFSNDITYIFILSKYYFEKNWIFLLKQFHCFSKNIVLFHFIS